MSALLKLALACALLLALIQIFVSEEYDRRMTNAASAPSSLPKQPNISGVIVMKVQRAEHATRTICSLNRFFGTNYPVRIFADYECDNKTWETLQSHFAGGDLEIIVDTISWRKLPPSLNETEKHTVLDTCINFQDSEKAMCSKFVAGLSYIYMGYWRYMKMAQEPSLQQFEYFISIDTDAYLTETMPDPFKIMKDNNLTGIFEVEMHLVGLTATGIQESVEAVFTLPERQNRFLDNPKYPFFNEKGKWHRPGQGGPSIWGFFFGGRLDFFRTTRYLHFARLMAPYTYTYRTDEQGVVAVAWSLLANNEKVWSLPQHGYQMGVYHQGFVDNSQVVKKKHAKAHHTFVQGKNHALNTLDQWSGFDFADHRYLISWVDYVEAKGYGKNDTWHTCEAACGKDCNPWIDPRTLPGWKDPNKAN